MSHSHTPLAQLERIVLEVPDPQATAQFLQEGFDFEIAQHDEGLLVLCEGVYAAPHGQGAIELVAGDQLKVQKLAFALPDDVELGDVAALVEGKQTSDSAVEVVDPSSHVVVSLELAQTLRVDVPAYSDVRPNRMGHVNLKSPKPKETAEFFQHRMKLLLSEYINEELFWLRTSTEHHNVALRPGEPETPHHLGMEIPGWQSYPALLNRLDRYNYKVEYGPGRHRPGGSYFAYVCDPASGLRIELFAEMAQIEDPSTPPIGWKPEDRLTETLNIWGPRPPQSFLD